MPSLTFSQAKVLFAPFITSQGPTDVSLETAINMVNERFITSSQFAGNRFITNFQVHQDSDGYWYFDTVPGVSAVIRALAVDPISQCGILADIMSDFLPWNEASIGFTSPTYTGDIEIIRLGNSPVYPLPSGSGTGAFTSDTQRYRIVGVVPPAGAPFPYYVSCLVRRGYVPLLSDTDLLIPSNINAYRYGLQAYNYENVNELERAQVYWSMAFQCLNDATASMEDGEQAQIEIQTKAFAPSAIQNLI